MWKDGFLDYFGCSWEESTALDETSFIALSRFQDREDAESVSHRGLSISKPSLLFSDCTLVWIQNFVWALYLQPDQLFSDSPLFWISHGGETSMRERDSRQGPLNGALLGGIKTKLPFRLSKRISQLHSTIFKQAGSKCTYRAIAKLNKLHKCI